MSRPGEAQRVAEVRFHLSLGGHVDAVVESPPRWSVMDHLDACMRPDGAGQVTVRKPYVGIINLRQVAVVQILETDQ